MIDVDDFKIRAAAVALNTAEAEKRRYQSWLDLRALCIASGFDEPMLLSDGSVAVHGPDGLIIRAPADVVYENLVWPLPPNA